MPKLANKVIVVIGGTTGLGLSAAKAFINAGAKVVVVGRNPENVAQAHSTLGTSAKALAGDASEPQTAPANTANCAACHLAANQTDFVLRTDLWRSKDHYGQTPPTGPNEVAAASVASLGSLGRGL